MAAYLLERRRPAPLVHRGRGDELEDLAQLALPSAEGAGLVEARTSWVTIRLDP